MNNPLSRRKFLSSAGAAAALPGWLNALPGTTHNAASFGDETQPNPEASERIVDMHVHFDEKNPNFISDFLKVSEKLNLTACVLTPFASRKVVLDAAKQHPAQIIPFGFVDLDAPDVVKQDRKSTRLNSSHPSISYAVFCLKKKKKKNSNH